jgi:hypothetical protein
MVTTVMASEESRAQRHPDAGRLQYHADRPTALHRRAFLSQVLLPAASLLLALSLCSAPLAADARTLSRRRPSRLVPGTLKSASLTGNGTSLLNSCPLTLVTGLGEKYTYSNCYAAEGGFSIQWNHTVEGTDTLITFGVQKWLKGWTAAAVLGTSTGGDMPQGSVVMSIYKRGRVTVQQAGVGFTDKLTSKSATPVWFMYYLSDKDVSPGGSLVVSNFKADFAKGLMTTFATIKLPTDQAQGTVNLLYANAAVTFLSQPTSNEG